MDDDHVDPEVQDELSLRRATMRDRTRTRGHGVYDWTPPATVDRWRCRGNCGGVVSVTAEAMYALEVHNSELARRGEPPLDTNKIAFCDKCREQGAKVAADRNRKHVDALALIIRELVQIADADSQDHDRERTLLHNAKLMHHPDLDGLQVALREKRKKARDGGGKKPRRNA